MMQPTTEQIQSRYSSQETLQQGYMNRGLTLFILKMDCPEEHQQHTPATINHLAQTKLLHKHMELIEEEADIAERELLGSYITIKERTRIRLRLLHQVLTTNQLSAELDIGRDNSVRAKLTITKTSQGTLTYQRLWTEENIYQLVDCTRLTHVSPSSFSSNSCGSWFESRQIKNRLAVRAVLEILTICDSLSQPQEWFLDQLQTLASGHDQLLNIIIDKKDELFLDLIRYETLLAKSNAIIINTPLVFERCDVFPSRLDRTTRLITNLSSRSPSASDVTSPSDAPLSEDRSSESDGQDDAYERGRIQRREERRELSDQIVGDSDELYDSEAERELSDQIVGDSDELYNSEAEREVQTDVPEAEQNTSPYSDKNRNP